MTTLGQSVIKNSKKIILIISKKTSTYIFSLLCTIERKNYTSMARTCNKSYDEIYIKNDIAKDCIDYNKTCFEDVINIIRFQKPTFFLSNTLI